MNWIHLLDHEYIFLSSCTVPGANDAQKPEHEPTLALPSLVPAQLSEDNPVENLTTAQISTGKRLIK